MLKSSLSLAFLVLAVATPASAQEADKALLPGGASSLQESYQDWRVVCGVTGSRKYCAMQQQQVDGKSGQRVIAIELLPDGDNASKGTLLMPFGLALDAGVSLALDNGGNGKPLPFKTCLPSGCVVPLALDAQTISALRNGKQLKLSAKTADETKAAVFTVSLKGFGPAYDRTAALLK